VELELAKCKMDMMSLNSQLLDAIQQKLNLSQQLEAWQVSKSPGTRARDAPGFVSSSLRELAQSSPGEVSPWGWCLRCSQAWQSLGCCCLGL
jgi:hypothetical protein